jgi:hypothetical protein
MEPKRGLKATKGGDKGFGGLFDSRMIAMVEDGAALSSNGAKRREK